jgi:hypothetical protein
MGSRENIGKLISEIIQKHPMLSRSDMGDLALPLLQPEAAR